MSFLCHHHKCLENLFYDMLVLSYVAYFYEVIYLIHISYFFCLPLVCVSISDKYIKISLIFFKSFSIFQIILCHLYVTLI